MFNVLIVDDEPKVREGLKTIINWKDHGYCICGECADGIEGLDMVGKLKPDLVLVDIRMPEMNGLEFIEKAKKAGCISKFIILTGYSDFTYTKKAIQLGVYSYLLKPVEEEELVQTINQIREAIICEREVTGYIDDGKKYSRDSVVKAILMGDKGCESSESHTKSDGFASSKMFQVAMADIRDKVAGYNPDAVIKGIYSELSKNSRNENYVFEIDGRICIVLADGDTARNKRTIKYLSVFIKGLIHTDVLLALGRMTEGLADINISYKDATGLIDKKFYFMNTGIAVWDELKDDPVLADACTPVRCGSETDIVQCIEKLFVASEVGDGNRIETIVSELFSILRNRKYSEMKFKGFCSNVLNAVYKKALEQYPVLAGTIPSDEERITGVDDKTDICQLLGYLIMQLGKLAEYISSVDTQKVIKKIIKYIEDNYHQDLTLDMLGGLFGYNSCYLGKVFRHYTGEHFNVYLEKVRIGIAKTLLLKGYKVSEVACRTGFKNIDYFYLKFKKNVGVSTKNLKEIKCLIIKGIMKNLFGTHNTGHQLKCD